MPGSSISATLPSANRLSQTCSLSQAGVNFGRNRARTRTSSDYGSALIAQRGDHMKELVDKADLPHSEKINLCYRRIAEAGHEYQTECQPLLQSAVEYTDSVFNYHKAQVDEWDELSRQSPPVLIPEKDVLAFLTDAVQETEKCRKYMGIVNSVLEDVSKKAGDNSATLQVLVPTLEEIDEEKKRIQAKMDESAAKRQQAIKGLQASATSAVIPILGPLMVMKQAYGTTKGIITEANRMNELHAGLQMIGKKATIHKLVKPSIEFAKKINDVNMRWMDLYSSVQQIEGHYGAVMHPKVPSSTGDFIALGPRRIFGSQVRCLQEKLRDINEGLSIFKQFSIVVPQDEDCAAAQLRDATTPQKRSSHVCHKLTEG